MTRDTLLHPGLNLGAAHGTAHTRSEPVLFGFWVFLMSDLIIFGILFATYVAMRDGTAGGPGPHELFNLSSIAVQTGLLLLSSMTYGLASLQLKHGNGQRYRLVIWLIITAALGLAFLGFELADFHSMAQEGGVPSRSGWLSAYYALVGLHGLHITLGLLWIAVMLVQIRVLGLNGLVKTRLLMLGLYWHFLDLVWIGIFSIVFLAGVA
ncbi:cytochrome c oxidase subunit 3 [Halomonas garicola]|uniref:cytochrome c oxidase subunit 3 n=1 Tax=Halomonas garicola TaxID=1690008 RepID=UPI00289F54F0|nr:cytochrome c oxidase subunit 3 [Halomonas garicola]